MATPARKLLQSFNRRLPEMALARTFTSWELVRIVKFLIRKPVKSKRSKQK